MNILLWIIGVIIWLNIGFWLFVMGEIVFFKKNILVKDIPLCFITSLLGPMYIFLMFEKYLKDILKRIDKSDKVLFKVKGKDK